jgi:RNA-directed DNA polymerase
MQMSINRRNRLSNQSNTTEIPGAPFNFPEFLRENKRGMPEKVFLLRQKLYRKAKMEPKFRFYALYDRIYRMDVLRAAWNQVAANDGAPGVDGRSIADIASSSTALMTFLEEIQETLKAQTYQPDAVRRKMIPKANGGERPLGIPTVRDRVVQTAAMMILEPIFEADFQDTSYGFRPGRSAHDALDAMYRSIEHGRTAIIDADLKGYFDTIPHERLLRCVEKRIADGKVLQLIRSWLRAPMISPDDPGKPQTRKTGTPQGGVISPLLANIYLHWLDKLFAAENGPGKCHDAKIVRYADDFVIMAKIITPGMMAWLENLLENRMGLTINRLKTRIAKITYDGKGSVDFLGYSFRIVRSHYNSKRYLSLRPSAKTMQRFRQRIREIVSPRNYCLSPPRLAAKINDYLRGWRAYFAHAHRGKIFTNADHFLATRLISHFRRKSQRPLKPPTGVTWYYYIRKTLKIIPLSGNPSTANP